MSRRRALAWFGGLGVLALLPACGGDSADDAEQADPSAVISTGATTSPQTAACILTPEQTEGPFYLDLESVRSDITEERPGMPLGLRINVVDADGCAPIADAAVDVWHCDAGGVYSGVEDEEGSTFLRGIQMTDASGNAEFQTLYPGWYTGRTVHIHLKVHVGGSETYTGQLYFDETVTDAVYETEPYASRPDRDTRNATDGIFSDGGDRTLLEVTKDGEGYSGALTVGVRRA